MKGIATHTMVQFQKCGKTFLSVWSMERQVVVRHYLWRDHLFWRDILFELPICKKANTSRQFQKI